MGKLDGTHILVVEDEAVIAMELDWLLTDEGATVSVEADLEGGLRAAHSPCDLAVLDVWLHGREVYPVADRLSACGTPIVFHSGHADPDALSARYRNAAALQKPAGREAILDAVLSQLPRPAAPDASDARRARAAAGRS